MIAYRASYEMPPLSTPSETGLRTPEASVDPNVGRTLGDRYRVLRRLGCGGMGTVYLCEHVLLRRRVAVKVLREDLARDPELVERFRNEAIAASRIGGDHVVDVLDLGLTGDGTYFYVMEALDGRSLGAVLREEGALEIGRALGLVAQVCRALSGAHARGVVHRDLKPDNVFVVVGDDGTERAKVIDFGISRIDPPAGGERLTRVGAIIGTPEYMSPEQAAGAPIDHRADVYGAGVLLYELLTGALPLEGETPLATLVAHQSRVPDPPSRRRPAIPPEVDAVVMRALAKRPEDRFDSMDAFAAELIRVRARLAPEPSRPEAPTARDTAILEAAPPAARPGRMRAALRIAAIAALVAAAAFGGWWWRGARSGDSTGAARAENGAALAPQPAAESIQEAGASKTVRPLRQSSGQALRQSSGQALRQSSGQASTTPERTVKDRTEKAAAKQDDPWDDSAVLKPDPFE